MSWFVSVSVRFKISSYIAVQNRDCRGIIHRVETSVASFDDLDLGSARSSSDC